MNSQLKKTKMKMMSRNHRDQILSSKCEFFQLFHTTNPNSYRYKRDYYINDDEAKHQQKNHSQPSPTKHAMPTHFNDSNEEIIKPKKKTYEEMTVSMLIEDVEVPVKYTRHDQDFSLTMSEDSETTRIYTPRTQQVSTFKGVPISMDGSEVSKTDVFLITQVKFEK